MFKIRKLLIQLGLFCTIMLLAACGTSQEPEEELKESLNTQNTSSNLNAAFSNPNLVVANFGYSAGNWRVDKHPRMMADVNGDGKADIVGFGDNGVLVSLAINANSFTAASSWSSSFGYNSGWRIGQHPRYVVESGSWVLLPAPSRVVRRRYQRQTP